MMNAGQNEYLDAFEKHLRVLKGLQPSSTARYRSHVAEFLEFRAGNAQEGPISEITQQDIELFLEYCYRKGNGNQARLTKLIGLKAFFRFLLYKNIISADPSSNVPRPKADKAPMMTFSRSEILRLFGAINITTEKALRDTCVLIFAAFAGLRISEIIKFNLNCVTDDGTDIDLNIIKTKKGENRVVYLWKLPGQFVRQLVMTRLAAGAKGNDPLFVSYRRNGLPRGNRRLTGPALNRMLKKLAAAAGIRKPKLSMHMLRASHANHLQCIKGYSLPAVLERMGWKDLSTAGRYLVHRERIHREYKSLHEFWSDFTRSWTTDADASGDKPGERSISTVRTNLLNGGVQYER